MKHALPFLPIFALFAGGCATQPIQQQIQHQTSKRYHPYKDSLPKKLLDKEQTAPQEQPKYLFDDTPVGSDTKRDSGSFLNQQKRQMDIQREHLRQ